MLARDLRASHQRRAPPTIPPHVFEIADRIHIHRLGKRVAVVTPQTHTMHDVVGIMTGAVVHDLEHPDQEPGEEGGPPADGAQPGATQAP